MLYQETPYMINIAISAVVLLAVNMLEHPERRKTRKASVSTEGGI